MKELRREFVRKAFHALSLVYLAAYIRLGRAGAAGAIGAWLLLEGLLEVLRLRVPAFNDRLMRFFGGIHRESEFSRASGIWWSALGSWAVIVLYGDETKAVTAALLYLAFGDGAAALVGKSWGRHTFELARRRKSLEGSCACLLVCLLCGILAGLPCRALWAGALAATIVELLPLPFNDNLWLPLVSGLIVRLLL